MESNKTKDPESKRLEEDKDRTKNWKRWGPYLSERQWGTVREDYSSDGDCWSYFPHDAARSRAYRWGEDGIAGVCDRQCRLCLSVALWNNKDQILKERLFGLTGPQGNHGEDVKELYYYLDNSPTHSYMKYLYKYPMRAYPYSQVEEETSRRGRDQPEYEIEDTGALDDGYWDVIVEYSKHSPNNILMKVTVFNRSDHHDQIHVIPTLWFRNTWIWGCTHEGCTGKPKMEEVHKVEDQELGDGMKVVRSTHETLGTFYWALDDSEQKSELLFTENATNNLRLFNSPNDSKYVKDAFHRHIINKEINTVNPHKRGTKCCGHYVLDVPAGEAQSIKARLWCPQEQHLLEETFGDEFNTVMETRVSEINLFYDKKLDGRLSEEERVVWRQAMAGLLWSKQFYHYIVQDWIEGDVNMPKPPTARLTGRNSDWKQLFNKDVISMPDKWEYPWYASWDLAFHMVAMGLIDVEFAKNQLLLFLREWYMHPNGQIPAYEFALDDVNPPVHAWAVMNIYRSICHQEEEEARRFLARAFQKLTLNFTWWVNRKDPNGRNLFGGGFLGLDNIGIFDRSQKLPFGGSLEQADGTAWMAFFCVTLLDMALTLAYDDPVYEDMASKFLEHFILIMDAMNSTGQGQGLWCEEDGFYYDFIRLDDGSSIPLKIRSLVGLVPLFAVLVLDNKELEERVPDFYRRTSWFMNNRPDLSSKITLMKGYDNSKLLLAVPTEHQLCSLLKRLLDEEEFLSPYGIRSLSKYHKDSPFVIDTNGERFEVNYVPGESNTYMFGGNSNWRGPIWLPMNFLIITSLKRYHYFFGDSLKVECPSRSGKMMTLSEVAVFLAYRINNLFLPDCSGARPCHGGSSRYQDPHYKDLVLFYEYFDGDTGRGCGASHQTGWTALVANCLNISLGYSHSGLKLKNNNK